MVIIEKKYIPILGQGPTNELDDTTETAEAKYSVNIKNHRNKICLSLHYNAANSFLCANGVKIHQFRAKDSEIKICPLCLENISKDFTVNNMKKLGLRGAYTISLSAMISLVLVVFEIFTSI